MARRPQSPPPPTATRQLTKAELARLDLPRGSKRRVAASVKRVTKRTPTWSQRQAVQARKGMTKEAFTQAVKLETRAYASPKTAERQARAKIAQERRREFEAIPNLTRRERQAIYAWWEARAGGELSPAGEHGSLSQHHKDALNGLADRLYKLDKDAGRKWETHGRLAYMRTLGYGTFGYNAPDMPAFPFAA
jgi:hypothetical protein